MSVQGVGAKASLAILSALGEDGVSRAIALGDWTSIKSAKGIGPKTAQRVVNELKDKVINVIKKIYDPEIPVNIYDLGLIYKTEVDKNRKVLIEMTLTSPNCPVAESLPNSVKDNIMEIEEVTDVELKLVWDPPWTKDKMSEAAKLELNL